MSGTGETYMPCPRCGRTATKAEISKHLTDGCPPEP